MMKIGNDAENTLKLSENDLNNNSKEQDAEIKNFNEPKVRNQCLVTYIFLFTYILRYLMTK